MPWLFQTSLGILVDIGISDELAGKITDFLWGEVVKGE